MKGKKTSLIRMLLKRRKTEGNESGMWKKERKRNSEWMGKCVEEKRGKVKRAGK